MQDTCVSLERIKKYTTCFCEGWINREMKEVSVFMKAI